MVMLMLVLMLMVMVMVMEARSAHFKSLGGRTKNQPGAEALEAPNLSTYQLFNFPNSTTKGITRHWLLVISD